MNTDPAPHLAPSVSGGKPEYRYEDDDIEQIVREKFEPRILEAIEQKMPRLNSKRRFGSLLNFEKLCSHN
jgi:hypothetical protein